MSILTRVVQKIFGSTAGATETGVIGSEDAGSAATSSNLVTIQSLSQYLAGMYAITGGGAGLPKIEDINSLFLLITSQLAYVFQNGIPEYESGTNYYNLISYVQVTGVIYQSINGTSVTPNVGNTPSSSPTKWRPFLDIDSTMAANSDAVAPSQKAVKSALSLYARLTGATFTGTVNGTAMVLSGALSALTFNKLTLTQPATGATLTLADGKTLKVDRSITLRGGVDAAADVTGLISGYIQGLLMTWISTTSFSVGIGSIGDSTSVDTLSLLAITTKTTAAWAVGSGNGGLDTGAIGASALYGVFLIKRPDTGVVDVLYSLSATAPTLPANYTLFQRIGWVRTNGSSQFIQWTQRGRQFLWQAKVADLNAVTPASTNRILLPVTLPPNVEGIFSFVYNSVTNAFWVDSGWTALTDVPASVTNAIAGCVTASSGIGAGGVRYTAQTDASSQIYYRVSAFTGNTISILTVGWIDNL